MIRAVLAKDPDEPICGDCAVAFGLRPVDKMATISVQPCAVCSNERPCMAIRDYQPPGGQRAGKRDWQRPL